MSTIPRRRELLARLGHLLRNLALLLVLALLVAAAGGATLLFLAQTVELPRVTQLEDYRPPAATQVFAADGSLIAEFYFEKRYNLPIDRIPQVVRQAFVAAEDERFYEHDGVDLTSVFRAAINNTLGQGSLQGGSTITQQVVKSLLLTPERSYERKLKEMALAVRLERRLGKDEILELYLNHIYLGSGAHGVAAASRQYFGKSVEDLNLAEAALLAGLPQAPTRYSPIRHWHRAKARQHYVLRRMAEVGFLSPEEAEAAFRRPISLSPRRGNYLAAPHYVEQVRRDLEQRFGSDRLYGAGLKVYTAADVEMTRVAEEALRWGLEELHRRQGWSRKPIRRLSAGEMRTFLDSQKEALAGAPPPAGYRGKGVVVRHGPNGARVQLAGSAGPLEWPAEARRSLSALAVGDVLRVVVQHVAGGGVGYALDPEPEVEGAITAMDPVSGHVRVMVGGYDFQRSQFNRAVQAARQPGSAFKPFIFAAALDRGYTPASVIIDAPVAFPDNDRIWMPKNYDKRYWGPTTLREALTHSRNVITVKLANQIGLPYLIGYVRRFGIHSPLGRNLSIALGSAEVTLLELVSAYGVFANQGRRAEPILITRIEDDQGRVVFDAAPQVHEAISATTAYQVTSMLESAVQRGTGAGVRALGRPTAGKTGTTNDLNDAWFIGYTPQLLTGVWVGFDEKRSLGKRETGGRVAAPIWLRFMTQAVKGQPIADFAVPADIALVGIDPETGRRALPGEPGAVLEVFRRGTEPAVASAASSALASDSVDVRDFLRQEQ